MTTKAVFIERALRILGAHSDETPASPERMALAALSLWNMISAWHVMGVGVLIYDWEVPDADLGEIPGATRVIISNLALRLVLDLNIEIDTTRFSIIKNAAGKDMDYIEAAYADGGSQSDDGTDNNGGS